MISVYWYLPVCGGEKKLCVGNVSNVSLLALAALAGAQTGNRSRGQMIQTTGVL